MLEQTERRVRKKPLYMHTQYMIMYDRRFIKRNDSAKI